MLFRSTNKTVLVSTISSAETKSGAAVAGTEAGEYPSTAIDALDVAITTAKNVNDDADATQGEINLATTTLKIAISTFDEAKITKVLVIPAQSTATGLRMDFDTMNIGTLPIINTSNWGGANTTPTVVTDEVNNTKALCYTFSSDGPWYGCPWQGSDSDIIDISGYTTLLITYNDSFLDYEINTGIVQLVGGVPQTFEIAAGDFPGTISVADSNGWKTMEIPLSAFDTVDLSAVQTFQFSNQAWNPQLPETAPYNLNGKFYIAEIVFK